MVNQLIVFAVIALSLYLFVDGRIRYDFVSLIALVTLTVFQIVKPSDAFLGFGHPAVITVVAVLIISSALIKTGAVNQLVSLLNRGIKSTPLKILSLMSLCALLSAFMNNVGALALVMPMAISIGKEHQISPSHLLMPVAFASLLGGLITEIGTPPNLIISMYRADAGFESFSFFDFAPVGIILTIVGIVFTSFLGWRLIPQRKSNKPDDDLFKLEDYISEVVVTPSSTLVGKNLRDLQSVYDLEVNVLSIVREGRRIVAPIALETILLSDIMVIKADHNEISRMIEKTRVHLKNTKVEDITPTGKSDSDPVTLVEMVLKDESPLIGKTAVEMSLRNAYNINLVAISRKGTPSVYRLKDYRFRPGDILLIQAPRKNLSELFRNLGSIPLAERELTIGNITQKKKRLLATGLFVLAILLTSFGLLSVQVSFVSTALLMVLSGILTRKEFYEAIEWPVVIMLGALLPLGDALQTTGGATTLANGLIAFSSLLPASAMVVLLMVLTMILTNLINNSAAAVLMAPIAISLANQMHVSIDPLLMAVCVASSSAFLTPIGHQSNTLIMGPGGYRFGDYWRLGLPVSLLVIIVGAPLILLFWPLV